MQERTIHRPTNIEAQLAYNPRLDVEAFTALNILKDTYTPEEFQNEQQKLIELTKTNLITALAERLNVEIYRSHYQQKEGSLYHSEFYPNQPFLEIVKKGQQTREQLGSQEVTREKAEVEGFRKVQELLVTSPDAKVIMISPRGDGNSIYGHNFFDVYEKTEDEEVSMSRYSSKATKSEFKQAAELLDSMSQIPEEPQDFDFLKNPIVTRQSKEEILKALNLDGETMAHNDFKNIQATLGPQVDLIIKGLIDSPNLAQLNRQNWALNKSADILAGLDEQFTNSEDTVYSIFNKPQEASNYLSTQPIREVRTGCGISGANSPYSVSEFSTGPISPFGKSNEDQYGPLEIHCEECNSRYNRIPGKLEHSCKNCGGTKGIAC